MNNDLISRSALKKAFCNNCVHNCYYCNLAKWDKKGACYNCGLIDNAPTVEPFEPDYVGAERLKARQRGYEEGYHYGMEIGKTLNPKIKQGEWIPQNRDEEFYGEVFKCSACETIDFESNFCPKCGAKMITASEGDHDNQL